MKLLKKSTVNIQVAAQTKQQIDTGLLLAKKIDTLRETLASLEQQHKIFLANVKDDLERTTLGLSQGIEAKRKELVEIEAERQELLVPLDNEWEKINQDKNEIKKTKSLLEKGLSKIAERDARSQKNYNTSKGVLSNIKVRERQLNEVYIEAARDSEETKEIKRVILKDKERMDEHIRQKNQELLSREAEIAVKERENEIARTQNEQDRAEIISIKAQLADQRGTLERALKRI